MTFFLQVLKDMPSKKENILMCSLTDEQRCLYTKIMSEFQNQKKEGINIVYY